MNKDGQLRSSLEDDPPALLPPKTAVDAVVVADPFTVGLRPEGAVATTD